MSIPLPVVPNVFKLTLAWSDGSDTKVNCVLHWHYQLAANLEVADASNIADLVDTAYTAHLNPLASGGVFLTDIRVQDLATDTGVTFDKPVSHQGTLAGDYNLQSTCALMNHRIGRHYRGGRPRSYLPFGSKAVLADQRKWNDTFVSNMNAGWSAFVASVNSEVASSYPDQLVSVSYFHSFENVEVDPGPPIRYKRRALLRTGGPVVDNITSSTLRPVIGTQRRRLRS